MSEISYQDIWYASKIAVQHLKKKKKKTSKKQSSMSNQLVVQQMELVRVILGLTIPQSNSIVTSFMLNA